MNQPVILYALERRQNGAKNVFLTKSDVEGIIRIKQGDEQAPSGRRRRGAGGGAAVQGGAKNYSKKVLQFFQVLKGAGGQDILCRCVKRSGEWRWCPVVPLEELPRVIKEHHERATGFSGVEKLYTHRGKVGKQLGRNRIVCRVVEIKRPFGVTMYRLRSGAGVVEGMHQASRLSKAPPSLASELTFSGTAQRGVPVVSLNVAMAAQPGGGKAACALCGSKIHSLAEAHLDHIIPFSKGGPSEEGNAQLVHRFCNSSKGNKSDEEARWAMLASCNDF
ncbi:hypothetical protein CHLNCDRAFT_145317 [Chlorella variabilis]|uniref:HNH nuclease domain-containing protein n=1 Tax=Chlorella variabilis TaxID=554065 RepID=E1ZE60_CHLVA|nr:hypothetical protein CHLNCDRAFT_145317 [Chlorella variabilis]EFN55813.1 hypothetical protein CHLNCDRAFT_145317 [Chlorella variabilis]|eukprot:XP_005847915.1 hypothetical protein CHLNCDRAFT_145317 [Chlorella variabilis]